MSFAGPLRRHPDNPRYFTDDGRRAVYLTGSHHWDSLQWNGERPRGFDWPGYLDLLERWGHSFIRLWTQEAWHFGVRPLPWARTGPGAALDGGPRFDLERFDAEYFARLAERVTTARARGFWVSVMLFQGWSIHDKGEGNPWSRHPFHRANNVNGVDGDPDRAGHGVAVQTLRLPRVTRLQERYVEAVVATVGGHPNVLYEIANESPAEGRDWQLHLLAHLRGLQRARGQTQPIGLTCLFPGGRNRDLVASPADWVSLGPRGGYRDDPPPASGPVSLLDTDHLWGIGGDSAWVWKAFLRGHQPLYMDPLDEDPVRRRARRAMGQTRRLAERLPLADMAPAPRREARGYCLAAEKPGSEELLVYLPGGGAARLRLAGLEGEFVAEWLDPATEATHPGGRVAGGGRRRLAAPFAGDAVLHLRRPDVIARRPASRSGRR